jgi:hypothetical protein
MTDLLKQVRVLKLYAIFLTIAIIILAVTLVFSMCNNHFKEITAERINIVEPNGLLRMVISDQKNQHPGIVNGKVSASRERPAGMIFFNNDGDEDGGLVYKGNKNGADMTYSFDQYKNDQVMQLQYSQDNDGKGKMVARSYGLKLWDRADDFTLSQIIDYIDSLKKLNDTNAYNLGISKLKAEGKLGQQRFFAGKDENGDVGLFLSDSKGIPRLKIYIDKNDQPVIQTLNEKGQVTATK